MNAYRHWVKVLLVAWVSGFAALLAIGGGLYLYAQRSPAGWAQLHRSGDAWYEAGMRHHHAERFDQAIAAFERSLAMGHRPDASAYNIACGHALGGDKRQAFAWLNKARALGFDLEPYLDADEDLASLRGDARMWRLRAEVERNAPGRHIPRPGGFNFVVPGVRMAPLPCAPCAEADWLTELQRRVLDWVEVAKANWA